ncbi:MAG TPA: hypothetical protein VGQ36_13510 [Thermoanaerobaculia bacterium]|jgi:hypothetical protein|nr:hypothetical protein [Thermoanaerobaculia bacterium]
MGWIEAIRFVWSSTRKDSDGKINGFLYKADDPARADYLEGPKFGRRVFLSFPRESFERASAFEEAFRAAGLEPWRYTPNDESEEHTYNRDTDVIDQIRGFQRDFPGASERIEATIRRCSAVLFLISSNSLRSAICQAEAFIASVIHNYGDPQHASVYVLLEEPVEPPVWLEKYWRRVVEPGIEPAIAALIASEIDAAAIKLQLIEEQRARVYR